MIQQMLTPNNLVQGSVQQLQTSVFSCWVAHTMPESIVETGKSVQDCVSSLKMTKSQRFSVQKEMIFIEMVYQGHRWNNFRAKFNQSIRTTWYKRLWYSTLNVLLQPLLLFVIVCLFLLICAWFSRTVSPRCKLCVLPKYKLLCYFELQNYFIVGILKLSSTYSMISPH